MEEPVYKKIQLVGTSTKSFSDAVANAIEKANKTVRHMSWFEVNEQRGNIVDGKVQLFQTTHHGRFPHRLALYSTVRTNGLLRFSAPTVVVGPCPGSSRVSPRAA